MGVLDEISKSLGIPRGTGEKIDDWHERLSYSAAGRVAILSLDDQLEDEPVSITHFKRRALRELKALFAAGGLSELNEEESDDIAEEIYEEYLKAGYVYHTPNRIDKVPYKVSKIGNVLFMRGTQPREQVSISGLGFYRNVKDVNTGKDSESHILNFKEMFHIPTLTLGQWYEKITAHRNWENINFQGQTEYLRVKGSFSRGYWNQEADRSGEVSLLRTGEQGTELYFLYRYQNGEIVCSSLPGWMTQDYGYRQVACAILYHEGTLPTTRFSRDGAVEYLNIGYLFPPSIQNMIMLYSWPSNIKRPGSEFRRIMNSEICKAVQTQLEPLGYEFIEEKF